MRKIYCQIFVALAVLFMPQIGLCDIPANYYKSINGRADSNLKNALHSLIYNHTQVKSYNSLPEYFRTTDRLPGTDYWWDMYSDLRVSIYWKFGDNMNR